MSYREMRLMVFFDLPTETPAQIKIYTKFRKFLLQDGFKMMQYSVYVRFCVNDTDAKKHINRVIKKTPKNGDVKLLTITNKQFEGMIRQDSEFFKADQILNADDTIVID